MSSVTLPTLFFNYTYPVLAPMFAYGYNPYQIKANATGFQDPATFVGKGNLAGTNTNWRFTYDGSDENPLPGSLVTGLSTINGTRFDGMTWNYTGKSVLVNRTTDSESPGDMPLVVDSMMWRGHFVLFQDDMQ